MKEYSIAHRFLFRGAGPISYGRRANCPQNYQPVKLSFILSVKDESGLLQVLSNAAGIFVLDDLTLTSSTVKEHKEYLLGYLAAWCRRNGKTMVRYCLIGD